MILQSVKTGRRIPPRLLEPPPEVHIGLELYMKAFFALAGDREPGRRISWSTIQHWCDANGLTGVDAEDVHFLLNRMDIAYLEWAAEASRRQARDAKVKEQMQRGSPEGVR